MGYEWHDLVGNLGVFLIVGSYFWMQIGRISGQSPVYSLVNAAGAAFILVSLLLAVGNVQFARLHLLSEAAAMVLCLLLLVLNLAFGLASLRNLGESWRVGVLEDQATDLVQDGIYRFSRNPYFVAYLLMFAAYTVLLQNLVLLALSGVGLAFIHAMILKEEKHLQNLHGQAYRDYQRRVARYLLV